MSDVNVDFNNKSPEMEAANRAFADQIIMRLNILCKDKEVRESFRQLIEQRVNVPESVADHPTLQVSELNDGVQKHYQVGVLGFLNGLAGVIADGPRKDWGFITAIFDDETGELLRFDRTKEDPDVSG